MDKRKIVCEWGLVSIRRRLPGRILAKAPNGWTLIVRDDSTKPFVYSMLVDSVKEMSLNEVKGQQVITLTSVEERKVRICQVSKWISLPGNTRCDETSRLLLR
jgi:hypothetical protein